MAGMSDHNCTLHHHHHALPAVDSLILSRLMTLLNVTLSQLDDAMTGHAVNNTSRDVTAGPSTELESREATYDFHGAMKFTLAVVLFYGIGVILMLGLHTKKSRWQGFNERETTRLVRHLHLNKTRLESRERKTRIEKLVSTIHSDPLREVLITATSGHDQTSALCSPGMKIESLDAANRPRTLDEGISQEESSGLTDYNIDISKQDTPSAPGVEVVGHLTTGHLSASNENFLRDVATTPPTSGPAPPKSLAMLLK